MGRVRMGYLIEIFLRDFLRVHMGRVRSYGISLIENFFQDFLRVHMERVRIGYLIENFFLIDFLRFV
jgi:hypothetical protein